MQLWFARDGDVPVRDQLATQLMLAIASGELLPGKRLPSTRALARRFGLNANTVSAAYQQLETLGWVESVRGSGVYVRNKQRDTTDAPVELLDQVVLPLIRTARNAGFSANAVRQRMDHWLARRPRGFVFVHPEAALRAIVAYELQQSMSWEVRHSSPDAAAVAPYVADSIFLTLPSQHGMVRSLLPAASEVVALQVQPVDRVLTGYLPIRPELLVAIASGWPGFLQIARTVLTAAGCDPDAVVFRDTNVNGWERAVCAASVVVCDVVTATSIPEGAHKIVFALVSEESIARLKLFERFFSE